MKQVEKHIIVKSKQLEEICSKAKNLYNQALYYLRQAYFGNIEKFSENELIALLAEFNQEDFRALPAACSQQIIKVLFRNWKAYYASVKDWRKHPGKYKVRPKLPKYKKSHSAVYFTKQQIRLIDGYVHFIKNVIPPLKTKVNHICQVRVIPLANAYKIEVVYEKEATYLSLNEGNILSLDLGLNNLATGLSNAGLKPFLINGKAIKSFNHWYNKKRAKLQSFVTGIAL